MDPASMRNRARTPLRIAKRAVLRVLAILARLLPWARRIGLFRLARAARLTTLSRRVGLTRLVYRAAVATGPESASFRAVYDVDPADDSGDRVLNTPAASAYARDAVSRGRYEEAIRVLERLIDERSGDVPPGIYHTLADAQRRTNDLRAAQATLREGLERHPDDQRLLLALTVAHAVAHEWADALASYRRLPELPAELMNRWSYVRIARMLRMNGEHEAAHALAAEGLRQHPRHQPLAEEYHRSRARVVDWVRSLVPAGNGTDDGAGDTAGEVDSLGFLHGDIEAPVTGALHTPPTAQPRVSLQVNGFDVVSTWPVPGNDAGAPGGRFVINCQDVLDYLGDNDRLTFTADGKRLTVRGLGTACVVRAGHPSRFSDLKEKLDDGFVFTKFGQLRPGHSLERKQAVLAHYHELSAVVEAASGRGLVPFYGNLLGAVREHDFISHDVGGFDVAFVATGSTPEAVKAEFVAVCHALIDEGYHLKLEPWCAMVRREAGDRVFVDINFAWFNEAGELNASYGWRHEPVTDRDAFLAFRECPLHDSTVSIPGNAEDVLVQLYGQGWRVPDQGFVPRVPLQRDWRYLLTPAELEEIRVAAPRQVQIVPTAVEADAVEEP